MTNQSPWAQPPKDYAERNAAEWDDTLQDDEPYNRCPFCNAAIAGVVGGLIIAALTAAAFAIKEGLKWLM